MKKITWVMLTVLIPFGHSLRAESPDEAVRMMQIQAEMRRMEEDFKTPVKVTIEKGRATLGNASAPIHIIEFSDFQCPFCQRGFDTVEALRQKYGKKVFFMFRHLPLSFHPLAMPAAKYFEAINLQGGAKAYKFHDTVFKNQSQFVAEGEKFLEATAKKLGVNMTKLKKDLESDTVKKRIESDQAEAQKLGLSGTPGFVAAGVRVAGAYPPEHFIQIIDRRLAEKTPAKKEAKKAAATPQPEKKE